MTFSELKDLMESFYDFREQEMKAGATDEKFDRIRQALDDMPDGAEKDALIMMWGPVERQYYATTHNDGKTADGDPLDKISLADINKAAAEAAAKDDGEEPESAEIGDGEAEEEKENIEETEEEEEDILDPKAEKKKRQREKAEEKKAKQQAANKARAKQQAEINKRLVAESAAAAAASYATQEQYRKVDEENRRRAVEAENMRRADEQRQAAEKIRRMEAETRRKQEEAQRFARENQGNYTNMYDEARRENRDTFYDQQKQDHSTEYKPQYESHEYDSNSGSSDGGYQNGSYQNNGQEYNNPSYDSRQNDQYSQNGGSNQYGQQGSSDYSNSYQANDNASRGSYDTTQQTETRTDRSYDSQNRNNTSGYDTSRPSDNHSQSGSTYAQDNRQGSSYDNYRNSGSSYDNTNANGSSYGHTDDNKPHENVYEQQTKQAMEDDYNAARQAEVDRMRANEQRMAEESRKKQEEAQRFAEENRGNYTNAAQQQRREEERSGGSSASDGYKQDYSNSGSDQQNQSGYQQEEYRQTDQDRRYYEEKGRERYEKIHSTENDVNRNQYQEGNRFVDQESYREAARQNYEQANGGDHTYRGEYSYNPSNGQQNTSAGSSSYSQNSSSYERENRQGNSDQYRQNYQTENNASRGGYGDTAQQAGGQSQTGSTTSYKQDYRPGTQEQSSTPHTENKTQQTFRSEGQETRRETGGFERYQKSGENSGFSSTGETRSEGVSSYDNVGGSSFASDGYKQGYDNSSTSNDDRKREYAAGAAATAGAAGAYEAENKQAYKQSYRVDTAGGNGSHESGRGSSLSGSERSSEPSTTGSNGTASGSAGDVGGGAAGGPAGKTQEPHVNAVDRDYLDKKGRERYEKIHVTENDTNRNQYNSGSRFVNKNYGGKEYGRSIGSGRDVTSTDQIIYHAGEKRVERTRGINIGSDEKITEAVRKTVGETIAAGGSVHHEGAAGAFAGTEAAGKAAAAGAKVTGEAAGGFAGKEEETAGGLGDGTTADTEGGTAFHGRHMHASGTLLTNKKHLPLLRLDRAGRLVYRFNTKPVSDALNQVAANGNDHVNTGKAIAVTTAGIAQLTVGGLGTIGNVGVLAGTVLRDGPVNISRFWLGTDHAQLLDSNQIQVANRVRAGSPETDYLITEGAKISEAKGFKTQSLQNAITPFKSTKRLRKELNNIEHGVLAPYMVSKGKFRKVNSLNVKEVKREIERLKGLLRTTGLSEARREEITTKLNKLVKGLEDHNRLSARLAKRQRMKKGRANLRRGMAMLGHVMAHEADGAVGSVFSVAMMSPEYLSVGVRAAKVQLKFVGWAGKKIGTPIVGALNVATRGELKKIPGKINDKKAEIIKAAKSKVKNSKALEALNGGIHNEFVKTKIGNKVAKGERNVGKLMSRYKGSAFHKYVGKAKAGVKKGWEIATKPLEALRKGLKKIADGLNIVKKYVYIALLVIFAGYVALLAGTTAVVIIGNWIMPDGDVTKSLQYYVSYAQQCADTWYGQPDPVDWNTYFGLGMETAEGETPPTAEKHNGKNLWDIMNQKTSEKGKYRIITVRYVDKNGNEIDSHDNLKEIISMVNVKLQGEWPEHDNNIIASTAKDIKSLATKNITTGNVKEMIAGLYKATHSWKLEETAKYKYYVEINHGHPRVPNTENPAWGGDASQNNTVVHNEVKGDAEGEACESRTFYCNETSVDSDASEYRQVMDSTYGLRGGCEIDKQGTGKYYAVDGNEGQAGDSFLFGNGTTTISNASAKKLNERKPGEDGTKRGEIQAIYQEEQKTGGCAFGKHNPRPDDRNSWSRQDLAITEGCQDEIWKYKYNTGDPHTAASAKNRTPSGVGIGDCSISYPSWVPNKSPYYFGWAGSSVTFHWGYAHDDDEEQSYYCVYNGRYHYLPDSWNDAPYNNITFYQVGAYYYPQGTTFTADQIKLYQCQERYCKGHTFQVKTYSCPGHTEYYCDGNHQDANVEVRIDHFPEMFEDDVESENKYPMKAAAVTKLKLDHQDPDSVKADGTKEAGTKYYKEENGYPTGETVLDDKDNPDSKREKIEDDFIDDARKNKNDLIFRWTQDARDAATQYTKSSWYEMYQETDENGKVVKSLEGLDDATMELDDNYIAQYKQIVKDSLDELDDSSKMDGDVADAEIRKKVIDNALSLVGRVPFESGGTKGTPADTGNGEYYKKTDFGWNDNDSGEHAKENITRGLSSGGLVSWVYHESGRDVDNTAGSILKLWKWGHVYKMDESEDDLRPGDVGIVNDYANRVKAQVADGVIYNHVGIYLGTNSLEQKLWIESSPTTGVVSIVSSNAYVYYLKMGATSDAKNLIFGDAGDGSGSVGGSGATYFYQYLKKQGLTDEAIAGIMGNVAHEGGVGVWNNAQDGMADDVTYTEQVDSGKIGRDEFIHDGIGYGPVQLTFWTVKAALYDNAKAAGKSIADPETMMKTIVQLYQGHFSQMNAAGSPEAAAEYWMDYVERPGYRNLSARQASARDYYNKIKSGEYDLAAYLDIAKKLANDDRYVYVWGGHGPERGMAEYQYDCAGFVGHVLYLSGIDVGYITTRTMGAALKAKGFQEIPYSGMASLQPGDILVNPELHTEIYYGNGQVVGSHTDGSPAPDQISITGFWEDGWRYVYRQS